MNCYCPICCEYVNYHIMMTKCNQYLYKKCFVENIKNTNYMICLYYKNDHTKYDKEYIIIIEIYDEIDQKKWKQWKIKNNLLKDIRVI